MELKDLIGKHKLSGVDFINKNIKREWGDIFEDCETINFILDGITYVAIEDPDDGYRSSMREIKITDHKVQNIFQAIEVLVRKKADSNCQVSNILEFIDTKNGKVVMEIGTDNEEDYYPYFVSNFNPENMNINSTS